MAKRSKSIRSFPYFPLTLVLILTVIWYSLKLSAPKPTPLSVNEIVATGSTTLEASPAPTHQTIGREFILDLNAQSDSDQVSSVGLNLSYDNTALEIKSLTKTGFLPVIITTPIIAGGRVTATFGLPTEATGSANSGTIAKISIKPLKVGKHLVEFSDSTHVTSFAYPNGALTAVTPIEINVYHLGDIDKNKGVYLTDYNLFVTDFGKSGASPADLDGSGQVNMNDYQLFVANYGRVSP